MGKMKATLDRASARDVAASATSNVTPIKGRLSRQAIDRSQAGEAAGAPTADAEPAVILFGLDGGGKAHAAWFSAAYAELAERAAGLMRFRVLRVTAPDIAAKALELATGKIFSSGRALAPFCKMAAYEALQAFPGAFAPPEPQPEPPPVVTDAPRRWEDIGVGSLVLATVGDGQGWFEAIVAEARGESLFVLQWRDWPDDGPFVRRTDGLALLPERPADAPAAA